MPTILTKRSNTPGAIPATANLTNAAGGAELAVNTADKRLFTITSGSQVVELGTNPASLTCADGSFTLLKAASASITNLTATSLVLSNLSIASANVTVLTSASATITNLLATTLTVSGVGIFPAGSAASAAITTTGDTNTGIFFPAADTIAFAEGGVEAMRIDSAANVGIGTSSPVAKLDVVSAANTGDPALPYQLRIASTEAFNASPTAGIMFANKFNTGGSYAGMGGIKVGKENATDGNFASYLAFLSRPAGDAVTEQMRLTSSGNLGLGVSPSAWGSTTTAFQITQGSWTGALSSLLSSDEICLSRNAYYDGSNWKYVASASNATFYQQSSTGTHSWHTAPSGTAGNNITFTQAMTLRADGRLVVGASNNDVLFACIQPSAASALLPTYSFDASKDVGMYSPATSTLGFVTGQVERARITSGGYFKASDAGTYNNATGTYHEFRQTANTVGIFNSATNGSLTDAVIGITASRAASNAYQFMYAYSGGFGDLEFNLRGDGNAYADGTWNNNGADYAEFFESATGAALTVGATVVLDGNKVREATASDPVSSIMGVVRPKEPGKASMMVGNTAWNKWANKYLTDDFDRYIMEDHDVVEWTDADGKQHSYESHRIPADFTVPSDAVVKTHDDKGNKFQHYKLNPAYNPDSEYTPREKRDEWIIVGLVGQVKVLKGKPVNDRWIKMRDVSAAVEEWMIR